MELNIYQLKVRCGSDRERWMRLSSHLNIYTSITPIPFSRALNNPKLLSQDAVWLLAGLDLPDPVLRGFGVALIKKYEHLLNEKGKTYLNTLEHYIAGEITLKDVVATRESPFTIFPQPSNKDPKLEMEAAVLCLLTECHPANPLYFMSERLYSATSKISFEDWCNTHRTIKETFDTYFSKVLYGATN